MRKLMLIAMLFLFGFSQAQTTLFSEDFESLPLDVVSSGSSNWARSSVLAANGTYSDTASITATNDTTILTTVAFSAASYSNVILKFNHIAKVYFTDQAYLEVSANNGATWTRLTHNEYKGYGYFGGTGTPAFSAASYPAKWNVINNTLVPDSSWWRGEIFDLSALLGNQTQVKVRFVLTGSNTQNYGWLVDDIEVLGANHELVPPRINLLVPYPSDTVLSTGPFQVNAEITDSTGTMKAAIVYTANGVTDTAWMNYVWGSTDKWSGYIPAHSYGTSFCYHLEAWDSLNNHSSYPVECISFYNKKDPTAPAPFHYDAGMHSVISPEEVIFAGSSTPVTIRIVNRGDSLLTKAKIGWVLDGTPQTTYTWTGALTEDLMSDSIILGSRTIGVGQHHIQFYTFDPNDSIDQNTSNDTLDYTFYACNSILSGVYTLGGSNADFTNFQDLMNVVNNCGLNGPTTINVNPGYYNEQVSIGSAAKGLDSINSLTIKSATGNPNDVIIAFDPGTNQSVLSIDSISGITFKNVTIQNLAKSGNSNAVSIGGTSAYIYFDGCKIIGLYSSLSLVHGIYVDGTEAHNLTFVNNEIIGGYYGIKIQGSYSQGYASNLTISNNDFHGFFSEAIYLRYIKNLVIDKNYIHRKLDVNNNKLASGINISYGNNVNVTNNRIELEPASSSYGISLGSIGGSNKQIIANNMISISGTSTSTSMMGIKLYNASNAGVYFNSVAIYSGSTTYGSALYISGSTTSQLEINNNIFANFKGGLAFRRTSGTITSLNYNAYYTSGLIILKWDYTSSGSVSNSSGITGIRAVTGDDTNSVVTNPMFYSIANLHSFGSGVNDTGLYISAVPTDIDGEPRSTSSPDIGADEFSISAQDAGVLSLISPAPVDTQSNTVAYQVLVKNYGSSAITSMLIKHSFDGSSYVSYNWTGNLATGATDTVTLGTVTVPFGDYSISAYTVLSGDTLNYNDTLNVNMKGLPLVDLQVLGLTSPMTGCGKTNAEPVSILIRNNGVGETQNSTTVSYRINGGSFVTETLADTIGPNDSLYYTFNTLADVSTGYNDSTFEFTLAAVNGSDPLSFNDTTIATMVSLGNLPPPVVSDTSINYGDTAYLHASSTYPVYWYADDTTSSILAQGTYTTPGLFDTTTYYAQANLYNPPAEGIIGTASTTIGFFDPSPYGVNMGGGRYQVLYTAAELSAAGLTAGNLEAIAFNVMSNFNPPSAGYEISLANVTNTSLTTTFLNPTFTAVYSGTFSGQAGWNVHNFSTPFYWDGTSSLLIQICMSGNPYNAAPVFYTTTSSNMVVSDMGMMAGCSSTAGMNTTKRPNIKIYKGGTNGCYSAKVPLNVNVQHPAIEARVVEITEPKEGCGLSSTPVSIAINNNGLNAISGNFTATYKINSGSYITPETITGVTINPGDTFYYTFNTLASLPAISTAGTKYVVSAKVSVSGDGYPANDELASDSILSLYTPANPVVTASTTINHGASTTLTATSNDSVYWFLDTLGINQVGSGLSYTTDPLYDTTNFYAQAQYVIGSANYTAGNGTSMSGANDPSPYGAGNYTGYGARHQFMIRADELQALGMIQGPISAVAFNVIQSVSTAKDGYTIRIGQTTANDLDNTYLINGLTTVYTSYSYSETTGWNQHNFSTPFYWDGSSNIVIETCFNNNVNTLYSRVQYTSTPYTSVAYNRGSANWSCSDSLIDFTSSNRPNIRLTQKGIGQCKSDMIPSVVNVINTPNHDASLVSITEPVGSASSSVATPVKVVLRNYGLNALTSASINWKENGVMQPAYNWTGNLAKGDVDTVTIDPAHNFMGGMTELQAWVTLTNDTVHSNDTATANISVCMSGTYTINPSSGHFNSFTDAVNEMQAVGVCGAVTFNVDSATYNEQVMIPAIPGASSTNTITFQSTQMDSTKALLTYSPSQNQNYVLRFGGAHHIIIKNLSIIATGANYANVFDLANGAGDIELKNNYIKSVAPSAYNAVASAVYSKYANTNNLLVKNNYIENGYTAIYLYGTSGDSLTNIEISNNIFNNYVRNGIDFRYVNNLKVNGNEFTSNIVYSNCTGIYGSYNANGLEITKNKMVLSPTNYGYGIRIFGTNGSASNYSNISNNFISVVAGTGSSRGIYLSSANYTIVGFNSINLFGGGQGNNALYNSGGTKLIIKNNIFAVRTGYTMYITSLPSQSIIDYNDLWVDTLVSNHFVKYASDLSDLAALKAFDANNNQNSISIYPNFIANNDLHTQQSGLYMKGTPIAGITTDIDDETRNTTAPTIGADEFVPPAIDLGIMGLMYPAPASCGMSANDSIVIRINNNGINNLNFATTNATISVFISGVSTDTITYTLNSGIMISGDYMDVHVTNSYDFSANGIYNVSAEVSIAGDGNGLNDNMPGVAVTSYPEINSFPFTENFESGVNISFFEEYGVESKLSVASVAANASSKGLHFQGGSYSGWSTPSNVTAAFANTSHVATAKTCNVDATNMTSLSLQFDLRQTKYSQWGNSNSWFRVLVIDANNNMHYLKDAQGDSVFRPQTINSDPWVTHTFSLNPFTGQNFQILLQAANKYSYGYGSYDGDNAFVDNIIIWEPAQYDVAINDLTNELRHGKNGESATISFSYTNIGFDTLYVIPVAYTVDNGTIVRDTINTTLAPLQTDTFSFNTPYVYTLGLHNMCIYSEMANDGNKTNDTACVVIKGMDQYIPDYFDGFEIKNDWFGEGAASLWVQGSPNKNNISGAHSGQQAWVTGLSQNYPSDVSEYVYSPYFNIPAYSGPATLEFYLFMDTYGNNAHGVLEYSFDGITWSSYGYMGMPGSVNWYNLNINGNHVWSATNTGWTYTKAVLDSAIFNNGNSFQFRFKFASNSTQQTAEGMAFDDFKITLPKVQLDAGAVTIIHPAASSVTGDSIAAKVVIKNYGSDTLTSIPVNISVDGSLITTETWSGVLDPNDVDTFSFTTKYVVPGNNYKICAFTSLAGDMIALNDSTCKVVSVTAGPIDAGVSTIIAPNGQASIGQPTEVKITIRNYGTNPLSNIPVAYFLNGGLQANETFNGTINPGDSADYTFTKKYVSGAGLYTICSKTLMPGDVNPNNDGSCVNIVGTDIGEAERNMFNVAQNQPNPAKANTVIDFYIPKSGQVEFKLVNMLGAVVEQSTINYTAGDHQIKLNTNELEAGVYYYSVSFDGETKTFKMIVVR